MDVLGILLAPEEKFPDKCLKDIKLGIIKEADLIAGLKLKGEVGHRVVLFLENMQLCHRYLQKGGTPAPAGLAVGGAAAASTAVQSLAEEGRLFFPALLKDPCPVGMWDVSSPIAGGAAAAGVGPATHLGRRFECLHDYHVFSAGFFPRIQVTAHTVLAGEPKMWRDGLKGSFANGVELAATMSADHRFVDVRVRAEGTELVARKNCVDSLNLLGQLVQRAREQSCEGVVMREYALSPKQLAITSLHMDVAVYDLKVLQACKEERIAPTIPKDAGYVEKLVDILGIVPQKPQQPGSAGEDHWDLFLSHDWGKDSLNHKKVCRIASNLTAAGYKVWLDENELIKEGTLAHLMARGINRSKVILVFVTKNYMSKVDSPVTAYDNCRGEFDHAVNKHKVMVPVVMEADLKDTQKWEGTVSSCLSGVLYTDMCATEDVGVLVKRLKEREEG